MPIVVCYRCVKCHQLTTHEIVHVSEDLKQVNAFTARFLSVLRQNKVEIHKIIEFTDQAPSQYRNKTAFNHITYLYRKTILGLGMAIAMMHVLGR